MTDPTPQRQAERVDVPGQVTGAVTVFQPINILNISVKGMLMESVISLQNDSLHDFRLSLADRSVVVKGRVVYCQIAELRGGDVVYRCGVEFVELQPHVLSALDAFVAVHKAAPPVIDGDLA